MGKRYIYTSFSFNLQKIITFLLYENLMFS
jgi:hypothetical protein